jgi:8-oxo-dGTP pyrophosphatase MutT (NUDIX family)
MAPIRRRSARVLVIDSRERVLLLRGGDPARPQHVIWHAPGGGVEPGESDEQAAIRELHEEVGLTIDRLGAVVWTRRLLFSFDNVEYDQDEVFFVHGVDHHQVDTTGHSDLERRYLSGSRWFTVGEIRTSADLVAPPDLADRLHELLLHGPPLEPVRVLGAVLP